MQNWNDLIRTQLNNLASFPAKQTWKLGEWTYECHVRPEVANFAALPLVGNELGDVRVSLADQAWYIWDGAAWQSMGGGGGGAVNSVTASAPIASSGGANPNISLTGVVAAANGGTGLAAPGAVGNVLTSNGVGWATAPLPASVTSVSGAAPLSSSGGTTPTISLTGIVPAANGGTGIAAPGVLGNVLTSNGAGAWTSSAPASTSPAAPLTSVQFNNGGAFGGSASLTWNGSTLAVDGAVDRATAGTLTVGGTTATAITVGQAGVTTSFPGPVNLIGDVTTVGGTQFTTDAQFDGNVTFGNAASDNISFVGQVDTAITQEGIAAPAVSPAGTGRIYFDSGTNTFKASQNGGAYVDIITGGTVTSVGASSPLSSSGGAAPSISFPSWPANASGALTNDGAGNLTWTPASGGTITGSGTATQLAYFTGASAIGSETAVGSNSLTWDSTNNFFGVRTASPGAVVDIQAGTTSSAAPGLRVQSTSSGAGFNYNNLVSVTSGVVGNSDKAFEVSITGAPSLTYGAFGIFVTNATTSTINSYFTNAGGPVGVRGDAVGVNGSGVQTGTSFHGNVGVFGSAAGSVVNVGTAGVAATPENNHSNVGVVGTAANTGSGTAVAVGGLFTVSTATGSPDPSYGDSAALIADNQDTSFPIFLARDNGTTTFSIGNDGVVLAKNTANSTSAFQVQDASSAVILDVDTTNDRVGILTTTPNEALTVNGVLSLAEGTAPSATASFGKFYALSSDSRPYFLDDGGQAYNLTLDRFNTLTPAASVAIDTSPALPVFNSIALNQNTTFTTSNLGNGRSASVRVICDGTTRTLTFPGGWTWLGSGPPSSLAANDVGYLSITAYGATDADVIAAWSYENAPAAVTGSGTATRVAFWDTSSSLSSSSNLYWDSSNSRLGVQTATPLTALDLASGQLAIPDGSAAAPAIAFRDDLNAGFFSPSTDIVGVAVSGTEIARLQQSGAGSTPALLMGTSTVLGAITVDSSDPSVTAGVAMLAHGAAGTTIQESYRGGQFAGIRTRGTKAAPTQVGTDDGLWSALGAGYTSAAGYNYGALITFKAEQAYTATASGGRIEFHTTANGTDGFTTLGSATTERMRIANDGKVFVAGIATTNTHTFNISTSGTNPAFAIASGGRIHYYDGSQPTDGQVLIGDTAGGNFAKATITAGTGISVTNGAGSITIAATGAAASTSTDITGYVAQEALNAGDLVRFVNDAGTPKVQKADATNTDARLNPVGFAVAAASAGAAVTVRVAGVADVPAARFDAAPGVANVGQRVFVSTTSGQITLTAPSASGDILQRAGVLVDGSGSPKVLVQVGDPTLL